MNRRWLRLIAYATAYAVVLFLAVFLAIRGYRVFNDSLTRGLEEEKSYTRHAMEYHRTHQDQRKGDEVLEVWSDADYIAQLVANQNSAGQWGEWSDNLPYLPENLRKRDGRPYCVIESPPDTIVIWFLSPAPPKCDVALGSVPPNLRSGDLEFSGREDYWVYLSRGKQK
jgi:hypothetical protein